MFCARAAPAAKLRASAQATATLICFLVNEVFMFSSRVRLQGHDALLRAGNLRASAHRLANPARLCLCGISHRCAGRHADAAVADEAAGRIEDRLSADKEALTRPV